MNALQAYPKEVSTHLALSALAALRAREPDASITVEKLTKEAHTIVGAYEWPDEAAADALDKAVGEM